MEKVKLTKEQAKGIESIKNTILENVEELMKFPGRFFEEQRPLTSLGTDVIRHAIFNGYEVEPEFNVGDWVTFEDGRVSKITKIEKHLIRTDCYLGYERKNGEKAYMNTVPGHLRHATPEEIAEEKERRWWEKHGREPWELKEDDVLTRNDDGFPWLVGRKRDCLPGYYLNGESFNLQDIRDRYRVMCFVDDRKDVNNE